MTRAGPFDPVRQRLRGAKRVVFVTGAGISQESGIPTFRGDGGLWRNHDPMKLATIGAFYDDPRLVWEWYEERRRNILAAAPNAGHGAIAALEEFADTVVLTQNIDGLHARAGSSQVLELHGSIVRIRCDACGFRGEIREGFKALPPACGCGGVLRPDVVWFGEQLPRDVWRRAEGHARGAEVMVVVGTSLAVSPANMLPAYARRGGALVIEINPEGTAMSDGMDLSVRQPASEALPELVRAVGG